MLTGQKPDRPEALANHHVVQQETPRPPVSVAERVDRFESRMKVRGLLDGMQRLVGGVVPVDQLLNSFGDFPKLGSPAASSENLYVVIAKHAAEFRERSQHHIFLELGNQTERQGNAVFDKGKNGVESRCKPPRRHHVPDRLPGKAVHAFLHDQHGFSQRQGRALDGIGVVGGLELDFFS